MCVPSPEISATAWSPVGPRNYGRVRAQALNPCHGVGLRWQPLAPVPKSVPWPALAPVGPRPEILATAVDARGA